MIKRLIGGAKRAFGLHRPGRNLIILPDDTFLVSYPKSGNTWARFLVANLLSPNEPADFGRINQLVPDPASESKRHFERMPRPRVIKSHSSFDARFPKVIYVVRDPRDVVVSEYHYQRKTRRIDDNYSLDDYVSRFVSGESYPLNGSWGQHVGSWLVTRSGDSRFLLVQYENMLSDTVGEMARIAAFLGLASTPQHLSRVVELSSLDRMRQLEARQSNLSSLTKGSRQDVAFVRSGKAGQWRQSLTEPAVAKIEDSWGGLMNFLGYELLFPLPSKAMDPVPFGVGRVSR